jgi:hypothetical protein
MTFPTEIYDLIWAVLLEYGSLTLLPCASVCSAWRTAILPRLFVSVTLFVEDLPRRLSDDESMTALRKIQHYTRTLSIKSRSDNKRTHWSRAASYAADHHVTVEARVTAAQHLPFFPQATKLVFQGIHFVSFEPFFPYINLVGSAVTHLHVRNMTCEPYDHDDINTDSMPLQLSLKPRHSLQELIVECESEPLDLLPILQCTGVLASQTNLRRLQVTFFNTSDLENLLSFLSSPTCSIRQLDMEFREHRNLTFLGECIKRPSPECEHGVF